MPERQNSSSQLLTPSPADGDPLSFSPGGSLTRRISASALDVTATGIDMARRWPSLSPAATSPAIASPVVASPSAPASARTSPTKAHAALSTPRPKRPSLDPDLLGIGSSGAHSAHSARSNRPYSAYSGFTSRRVSSGARKPKAALGLALGADDVLDTRYDEMGDRELQAVLDRWAVKPLNLSSGSEHASVAGTDSDGEGDAHETPRSDRRRPPLDPDSSGDTLDSSRNASPQRPHPARHTQHAQDTPHAASSPLAPKLTRSASSAQPLFPPSPPQAPAAAEHPLRVLSKAVRELLASVSRLEAENEALRDTVAEQAAQISRLAQAAAPAQAMASRPRSICRDDCREGRDGRDGTERGSSEAVSVPKSDQASIHDSLADALSTSLASPGKMQLLDDRPGSPSSYVSRPKSPALSVQSARSTSTTERPKSAAPRPRTASNASHKTWGSIWGWGKRPRKGSMGSMASALPEEDDDKWRHGDGGSTPGFRAVVLATRILTPDTGSILYGEAQPKLAEWAHTLVSNARDEGISVREPPGRQRARSRAASVSSQIPPVLNEPGQDAAATDVVSGAVAAGRSFISRSKAAMGMDYEAKPPKRPALLNKPSTRAPTTAVTPSEVHGPLPPPSVELASIVPDESRPPTVLLSRQNLGSFFTSSRKGAPKLSTATRFTSDQPPLTDRYGFIYDIQHASMLKDASRVGTSAPISLTGHNLEPPALSHDPATIPVSPRSASPELPPTPETASPPNGAVTVQRRRKPSLYRSLAPAPSRPTTGKDDVSVAVRGGASRHSGSSASAALVSEAGTPNGADSPSPAGASAGEGGGGGAGGGASEGSAASRLTVSSLLDQLTEIHDRQQKTRTAEWDAFLRKRVRRGKDVGVSGAIGAIIHLQGATGKAGQDEYNKFLRLVRRGIPIEYRSDVWAESCGARDSIVPGEYAEILSVHKEDQSAVMVDIDKDVGRTFPGNVFFGGDGPGVGKLRRVLVAYSWHNPAVGYCQGMNMLAATLLLTYTDEEQAFWVLDSMIDRLLPRDYYAPSLLGSRANQLVLQDLVALHIPKVGAHLAALGIDLTSITFGWFLSLFTDILPVETLFRVWDIFFLPDAAGEGGNEMLFRIALAILKINEADMLKCATVGDVFNYLSGIRLSSKLWNPDKLIALQHSYKGVLKGAEIRRRVEDKIDQLQREIDQDDE